jgi:hypothetical protein
MNPLETKCLATFADAKEHGEFEISILMGSFCRHNKKLANKIFRMFAEWDLIIPTRQFKISETKMWKLTEKGDLAYRENAIRLGGSYRYFKYGERNPKSLIHYSN